MVRGLKKTGDVLARSDLCHLHDGRAEAESCAIELISDSDRRTTHPPTPVTRRRPGSQEATMSDRVCLKCSGLSYADWRRGRNESPPCQRCGRREVAVRVIRTAGGAERASGEPVGRDGAAR